MADPICRWRNPYVNTIIELVKVLPHEVMPSGKFREIVEKRWPDFFHTPYQLACQTGLYYESEDGIYFPRFDHDIDHAEAMTYMKRWITRYYVPNPYTRSMKTLQQPQPFLASIIGYVYEHPDEKELHSILEAVFQESIGNIDIISNVLNTYTDLITVDTMGNVELTNNAIEFMKQFIDRNDKKAFFENFSESKNNGTESISKNLIFYGAPGTGKSRKIKDDKGVKEADEKDLVFRTTFHPDSDYSTFVGAYKPTMRPVADKYKAVAGKDEEITYSFVPQAFLQAYVAAWNNPDENVYLIIEEINRGNCAQIFGDLFQLLDRDEDGFSDYPIKADKDLANYLNGKDENGQDILTDKNGIKNGKLKLPRNLYIWATMNTSDQSLFPIDSAFKRRWDWQYMPISDGRKGWKIEAAGNRYNWWQFLEKINNVIGTTTHSEDKQLGYYFCRTKGGIINADTFVGKVIFYLWNDVFKDFADEAGSLFVDDDGNTLTFSKFYSTASGSTAVIEDKVALFLKNLGVDILPIVEGDEPDNGDDKNYEQFSVSYNGKVFNGKPSDVFISTLEEIGLEKLVDRSIGGNALVTREKPNGRSRKVGDYYIYTGWWPTYKKRWLEKVANELNIDLKFE